ncbi:hypothetical protein BR93DRAFT_379464 [Coniochaeta sp. PMI_546]|nr:hypothetical protein BR93DRAFT_379464 [Coniochaeta sp. PMI_546]
MTIWSPFAAESNHRPWFLSLAFRLWLYHGFWLSTCSVPMSSRKPLTTMVFVAQAVAMPLQTTMRELFLACIVMAWSKLTFDECLMPRRVIESQDIELGKSETSPFGNAGRERTLGFLTGDWPLWRDVRIKRTLHKASRPSHWVSTPQIESPDVWRMLQRGHRFA